MKYLASSKLAKPVMSGYLPHVKNGTVKGAHNKILKACRSVPPAGCGSALRVREPLIATGYSMPKLRLLLGIFIAVLFLMPDGSQAALRIGVLPASDSLALHVAKDEGLFAEHGLKVELIPFQSALEQSAALRSKAIQGWFTDPIIMLSMHESGVPQHIIATMGYSGPRSRFFGIAVPPGSTATSLESLGRAKTAISKTTIIEYVLDNMLENRGLEREHLERVDVRQISIRLQLLLSGKVDAAVLPEPLLSLVEAKGAKVVADNTTLSMPLAITAISQGTLEAEQVQAFQTALAEAMRRINAEPETYKKVMLEKKLLPRDAEPLYKMLSYPPKRTPVPLPTEQELEHIAEWMVTVKLLRQMPEAWDMIYRPARQ